MVNMIWREAPRGRSLSKASSLEPSTGAQWLEARCAGLAALGHILDITLA